MDDSERYLAAAHAVQSGVATEMNFNPKPTEPKHLRTGINTAMVEHAALVKLLVDKGIITDPEYTKAIADAMEAEKARYEAHLSEKYFGGKSVTLS